MDDSPVRDQVFRSALKNSKLMRLANGFYAWSGERMRAALLLIYGLKCHASLSRPDGCPSDILYLASYPSEKRVLGRVHEALKSISSESLSLSLGNCFKPAATIRMVQYFGLLPRLFPFARRVARRHSFMPACRVFSVVPYYVGSTRLLDAHVKAVFIASQYSPECLGLAAAAHRAGKRVFFVSHANATGENRYVPPIFADLVAVSSQALADSYQLRSSQSLNFTYWPVEGDQEPMQQVSRLRQGISVGIYLTGLTQEQRVSELLEAWLSFPGTRAAFIRVHPALIVMPDLNKIAQRTAACSVSKGVPLNVDIARTDLAICGESTVVTELLRAGCPVLYDPHLDRLPDDYNGYQKAGLVKMHPERIGKKLLTDVDEFYASTNWKNVMRYFDCGYQKDQQPLFDEFAMQVKQALNDF